MTDLPQNGSSAADFLKVDIDGAMLLLSYASRSGLDLDEDTISSVTRAIELHAAGKLQGEDLTRLYVAIRKLADLVAPATVTSLRAAIPATGKPARWQRLCFCTHKSDADNSTCRYRLGTLLFLILLVLCQFYWVFGSTALSSMKQLTTDLDKASLALSQLRPKLREQGLAVEESPEGAHLTEVITNTRNRLATYTDLLYFWNRLIPGLPARSPPEEDTGEDPVVMDNLLLERTPFILFALQAYILPLLFGLTGAFTRVLRTLDSEVRAHTFTRESRSRHQIRLVLGIQAGLAITWFVEPGNSALKNLSPLVLAFIAGYSVDVLYSVMDKFIAAFTSLGGTGHTSAPPRNPPRSDSPN